MNKNIMSKLFMNYSWMESLVYKILNILPPFIRIWIFKITLNRYGKHSWIDYDCYIRYPRKLSIGNRTTVNRGTAFIGSYYSEEARIEVGNNVAIGPYCTFYSAGHDYNYLDLPDTAGSIIVKDNVWIGGRCIILPGVVIEEGTIIGAGSVVNKSIPAWSVAVGNPARVIKRRVIQKYTED